MLGSNVLASVLLTTAPKALQHSQAGAAQLCSQALQAAIVWPPLQCVKTPVTRGSYQMALLTYSYRCLCSYCMTKMGGETHRKELLFIHFQEPQYATLAWQSGLGKVFRRELFFPHFQEAQYTTLARQSGLGKVFRNI